MILYFAYGSNMSATRMKQSLGWEAPRRAATLRDFQLVFDQAGFNDPSWSPANIRSEQGGLVEGMVYEVEEKDLKILDGYEKYFQRLEVKSRQLKKKIGCSDLSLKKIPRRKASYPGVFEFPSRREKFPKQGIF